MAVHQRDWMIVPLLEVRNAVMAVFTVSFHGAGVRKYFPVSSRRLLPSCQDMLRAFYCEYRAFKNFHRLQGQLSSSYKYETAEWLVVPGAMRASSFLFRAFYFEIPVPPFPKTLTTIDVSLTEKTTYHRFLLVRTRACRNSEKQAHGYISKRQISYPNSWFTSVAPLILPPLQATQNRGQYIVRSKCCAVWLRFLELTVNSSIHTYRTAICEQEHNVTHCQSNLFCKFGAGRRSHLRNFCSNMEQYE